MFQTRTFLPKTLLACFCISFISLAQEPVEETLPEINAETLTVTANRAETPYDQVGSSVTVITAADLQRSGIIHVTEALRQVAGLDVVQTGGHGQVTTVFMRGAESGHTLFMIDGIEMGEAISVNGSYDIGALTIDNIDRIEIVRGPQSTVYGSDALGGVIHIITKQGKPGFDAQVNLEGGSYGAQRQHLATQGGNDIVRYAVSGSHFDHDGFSVADERLEGNSEDDGYRNTSLAATLDVDPSDAWSLNFRARRTETEADLDNGGGAFQDDPNYVSDHGETFLSAQTAWNLFDGAWQPKLTLSYSDQDRDLVNLVDPDHPNSSSENRFDSDRVKLDFQNQVAWQQHQFTIGAETEEDAGKSFFKSESSFGPFESEFQEQEAQTTGLYLQDHMAFSNGLSVTLGGRYDDHDRFGSKGTYRAAAAYNLPTQGTTLRASYGTGFKAPSLFQLFSSFGNENLDPEESTGWDVSIDQRFANDTVTLGVTYFRNDFESLITFSNETFAYQNIRLANTRGLEARAAFKPVEKMWLALNASFLDTEDEATGLSLLRRADEQANLSWSFVPMSWAQVQADIRYVGTREDQDFSTFPAATVELDSFTTVNLASRFRLTRALNLSARIENLFDEEYQEVLGYGTPGFSGYLGLGLAL